MCIGVEGEAMPYLALGIVDEGSDGGGSEDAISRRRALSESAMKLAF